ncbi:MAG: hypothetical protein J6A57_05850 [Ruminococcus sp.]|nr:hypothetical protein [Ruminococcus sp.]
MKKILPDGNAGTFLKIVIFVIVLLIVCAVWLFIPVYALWITIILAAVSIILDCIYIPLYFRNLRYEMDGERIIRYSGVFFRSIKMTEFSAVRYTTLLTTPFSKHTGLNFAVLFLYGGRLRLSFLSESDVREIIAIASASGREKI